MRSFFLFLFRFYLVVCDFDVGQLFVLSFSVLEDKKDFV